VDPPQTRGDHQVVDASPDWFNSGQLCESEQTSTRISQYNLGRQAAQVDRNHIRATVRPSVRRQSRWIGRAERSSAGPLGLRYDAEHDSIYSRLPDRPHEERFCRVYVVLGDSRLNGGPSNEPLAVSAICPSGMGCISECVHCRRRLVYWSPLYSSSPIC